MKKMFIWKLFGGTIVILFAFSIIFLFFSVATIRRHELDTLTRRLENLGIALEPEILTYLETEKTQRLEAYLKDLDGRIKTRITVIDSEGKVLADSENDPGMMDSHRFRPEIFEALQGGTGSAVRFSTTVNAEMLYVCVPLRKDDKIVGVLRVSLFVRDVDSLLTGLKRNLLFTAGVMLVLFAVAAFFLSRNLSRPVEDMMEASQKVASGDFRVKLSLRRRGQWKAFAESFNAMTEKLRVLFSDQAQQRDELEGLISSMQEGLLLVDGNDKIVLSNDGFRQIVPHQKIEDRYYWEIIRSPKFVETLKKAKDGMTTTSDEVFIGDRNFLCRATYLKSSNGLMVTLLDMTEIQNVVRMKKDFIMNVSHELRTPLTAIKGFAETLASEVSPKGREYLEIILRHTDRLVQIVEDLLSLSELEEKPSGIVHEDVDLRCLAEHVVRLFEPRAKEKGLDIRFDATDSVPPIKGDGFRLEQMLINLVDNAVKYTDRGSVTVALIPGEKQVTVEVRDTGSGIANEHLPRIFERFYVVDASRSRKLGGTGLGLSLVKHIVSLHGGKIEVESQEGKGSVFRIILPTGNAL